MDDDLKSQRQAIFSLLGGVLFGAAWWCFIDGYSIGVNVIGDSYASSSAGYAWLPLFGATIAYIMINGMKWTELREDFVADPSTAAKARVFLLIALLIVMGSIAGSVFIMIDKALKPEGAYEWAGISCLLGTLLISFGAFLQRWGTLPDSDSGW